MTKLQISWYTTSKICHFFKPPLCFKVTLTIPRFSKNAFNT